MNFQKVIFALLFIMAIISCKDEKPQESTNNLFKFKEYINHTTSGVVSVAEPIRIDLAKEVEGWVSNEEILENIFDISLNVKGKLSALNTRSLLFQPSEKLQPNKEYKVTVKLGKLYANVPSEYKSYTFKFKTLEQNFNITTNNLQSYSKEWQYVGGIIKTADILDLEDAQKLVTAEQNNKKLKINWKNADSISTNFNFIIDSIQRYEDDSKILVSWDGSPINVDNDGKNELNIPGKNNFSIVNIEVFQSEIS